MVPAFVFHSIIVATLGSTEVHVASMTANCSYFLPLFAFLSFLLPSNTTFLSDGSFYYFNQNVK
jgi:hypothetical protein